MSLWSSDLLITDAEANQKMILVQAAAPAVTYSGQVWVCTSSDPPLLKVYDPKNTTWIQRNQVQYSTGADAYKTLSSPPTLNGLLTLQYATGGTQTSGQAFLYFKANNLFWGIKNT